MPPIRHSSDGDMAKCSHSNGSWLDPYSLDYYPLPLSSQAFHSPSVRKPIGKRCARTAYFENLKTGKSNTFEILPRLISGQFYLAPAALHWNKANQLEVGTNHTRRLGWLEILEVQRANMEPYMTNGFHFPGPRLFRPRGPSPLQFGATQLGFSQPRPMGMGHGLHNNCCRFRFPQNNLKQFPMQNNMWTPGVNNNGVPFQYHPQPCRFNMRRFEGPSSPPWSNHNQYRPQYFPNSPPRNHSPRSPNRPYHRNISLRMGGHRRPFLQGRDSPKISSSLVRVPEKCGTSHVPPSIPLCKIKQEPQDNYSKEDLNEEVDDFDDFICGNNAVPQENIRTQLANVKIKEDVDVAGTVGGDNPRVISMAVLIKQDNIVEESLNDVAVGSESCLKRGPSLTTCPSFKRIRGESGSDYSMYSSEEESVSPSNSQKVEEYEPENPAIVIRKPTDIFSASNGHFSDIKEGELISKLLSSNHMASPSRDEDGFDEVCVGVCVSQYPTALGRMMEVAGYGVWFSEDNESNFSGVLDSSRPQNLKAVMIHASSQALNAMKAEGYSKVRINLETAYLNVNVLAWIQKYIKDPKAESSNWDEFKYHPEILDLCAAANGMIIKWSHCSETSVKKTGLCKAIALARKTTDAWMKDLQLREEAVGTS